MRTRSLLVRSRLWRAGSQVKHAVLSRRVVTVRQGPAAGLRIGRHLASADYGSGHNELPVQRALEDHLRAGHTVFDIGSNVGFFALLAAKLVGSHGSVHAFEAVPSCARALQRNVDRNGLDHVAIHPVAVGERTGSAVVLQGRHPGGATISARDRPRDLRRTMTVDCVSIDDLRAQDRIPPPDLVKIDVEGAEAEVLRGMLQTLERDRPMVICEVDDPMSDGLTRKRNEIEEILAGFGYRVTELPNSYPASRSIVIHLLAVAD